MFTGIVQAMGSVASLDASPVGRRLIVDRCGWSPEGGHLLRDGDSICVSGVCLTLAGHDERTLAFDVIAQTLTCTTLGRRRGGDPVNLEPSLTPTTPMGGHIVQGHVDCIGEVMNVQTGEDHRISIQPATSHDDVMGYIVEKGSIAVDGVSLTIAGTDEQTFEVALIPTTLKRTTLGMVKPGALVNLETDVMARTVVNYLRRQEGNL